MTPGTRVVISSGPHWARTGVVDADKPLSGHVLIMLDVRLPDGRRLVSVPENDVRIEDEQ